MDLPVKRAPAIFAVKPPNKTTKAINFSNLKTSHLDISATILESVGITGFGDGQSVHGTDWTPVERYFIGDSDKYYEVNGSIFSPASWEIAGAKVFNKIISKYKIGQKITFGTLGTSHAFQAKGWRGGAIGGNGITWTTAEAAELNLKIEPNHGPLLLQMHLKPFIAPGKLDAQNVSLFVNNKFIKKWALSELRFQKIEAELGELKTEIVNIKFSIPNATAPSDIGVSGDRRKLGIAVAELILCSGKNCN